MSPPLCFGAPTASGGLGFPRRPCSGSIALHLEARVAKAFPLASVPCNAPSLRPPPSKPFFPLSVPAGGGSPPQNAIRIFSGAHQVPPTGVTCLGGLDFLRPPPAFIGRAHRRGVCLNWAMRVFLPYPPRPFPWERERRSTLDLWRASRGLRTNVLFSLDFSASVCYYD